MRVGIDSPTLPPCPQTAATGITVGRKQGKDEARRRFVIVAVLGNLDDFLMYFSIVVSLHFCWWESCAASGPLVVMLRVDGVDDTIHSQVYSGDDDRSHLHRDRAGHVPLVLT